PATEIEPEAKPRRPDWTKLLETAAKPSRRGSVAKQSMSVLDETAPIAPRAASRRRFSFSRLSGSLVVPQGEAGVGERPSLRGALGAAEEPTADDASRGDGPEFGTLVHGVLATLDFRRPQDVAKAVRRQMLRSQVDDPAQAAAATTLVERFLQTPRA